MKVLFVCRGSKGISPIIQAQADSLVKAKVDVKIWPIIGKGLFGYLTSIRLLRREIRLVKPDLVHAHYSFCGIVAALATSKPVVTSLMGSDVMHSGFWRRIIPLFVIHIWAATIVKSEEMKSKLGVSSVRVVPNGVDIDRFKPIDKDECRRQIGWPSSKKIILFAADPLRKEKNFQLASNAVKRLNRDDVLLKVVYGIPQAQLPLYYNASDLLILTSQWEGSPNVVKEAMSCNLPVVSTKVGDVVHLFNGIRGYLISDPDPASLSRQILTSLINELNHYGRARIVELGFDSKTISGNLVQIYGTLIRGK